MTKALIVERQWEQLDEVTMASQLCDHAKRPKRLHLVETPSIDRDEQPSEEMEIDQMPTRPSEQTEQLQEQQEPTDEVTQAAEQVVQQAEPCNLQRQVIEQARKQPEQACEQPEQPGIPQPLKLGPFQVVIKQDDVAWREELDALSRSDNKLEFARRMVATFERCFEFDSREIMSL